MINRRELLKTAGLAMAASQVRGEPQATREVPAAEGTTADWLKTCRALICEAYNPPFYPSFDYRADKAVSIATELNADSMRYPAASYFAYNYVNSGGTLIATHLTSMADQHGKVRSNFGLGDLFGAKFVNVEPVEIPDLYLKLPDGGLIPQDPQVMRFTNTGDGVVQAETVDLGHRGNLGPAIVRRAVGKGTVIYIGSGLEAVYAETRMKRLRTYMATMIDPVLATHKTYECELRSGVMPQLMASRDTILLHLIADTGNKTKKLRIREEFLPVLDVKVRVRVPDGRSVRSISLMRAGTKLQAAARGGWIDVTVPRVLIHEAVRVDLA